MADVPGTSSSTTLVVVNGAAVSGTIDNTDDQDWYKVALTKDVPYTFRVVGKGTGTNTLADPLIEGIYTGTTSYVGGYNNDGLISGPYGRDAMVTYTPSASVDHWVAVGGDMDSVGSFELSLTAGVINTSVDTVAADASTTGAISVGGAAASGTIDNASDVDWYRVALVGGTTYTFRVRGLPTGNGTLVDPAIAGLYDASGAYITNTYVDDIGTRDAALTLVAPTAGTNNYYLAVDGWSTYTGTYKVDAATATTNDVLGSVSSSTTLAVGASVAVDIGQPYDHDWYKVTLVAGNTYQYTLSGTGSNNTPGVHGMFSSAGAYLGGYAAAVLGPSTASASAIFVPLVGGDYFIDAYSFYEGSYTLSFNLVAADVPNKVGAAGLGAVAVGGSVTGDIGGATDIDWYKVTLAADTAYSIKMQGQQSGFGTLVDPLIAGIYDASGVLVPGTFSDDSDGNEPSLIFRPAAAGDYYIAADGYASYAGTFKLSVALLAGDVGQTAASAQALTLNASTLVTIDDAADTDWYGVSLTAGQTYGIRLQGAATHRGTLYDPILTGVYDSAGVMVADSFVDDAGGLLNPEFMFTPSVGGTYYVALDGYDRFTGTAKLAVTIDNIGITNALAGSFTTAAPAEGTIDAANDIDRYGVSLVAGTVYYIRMQGLSSLNGDLPDPSITAIYKADGITLAGALAVTEPATGKAIGLDSWYKLTPAVTGMYYVVAEGATTDGTFLLSATTDLAPGTNATGASVAVGGSVSGMIDEAGDTDWFAVSLEANTSYAFKMFGYDTTSGTLADPYINGVYTSAATPLLVAGTNGAAIDNAFMRESVVRMTTGASPATYYINATSSGSQVGTFVLSAEVEVGGAVATAAALAIGGSVTGMIDDTPDTDYYKVNLITNTSYLFKMLGNDSGNGTLDDPLIASVRTNGNVAVSGQGIGSVGLDSSFRWLANATSDFYVVASGAGADVGTFRLTAEVEAGAANTNALAVTVGVPFAAAIDDASDVDRYSVTLTSGVQYRIKLQGLDSGVGTFVDPYITGIRNAAGTVQTGTTQDGGGMGRDVEFAFTPAASVVYYIDVDNSTAAASVVGTYMLTVELW